MSQQAFAPEGGPVMPSNTGGWPGNATHPLPAPSAAPGATPLLNGGRVSVAALPPSNTSSGVSGQFDLERSGRSEREVSMALNDMASVSDGGAAFEAVVPGSSGLVAPQSSPVRRPASLTPSVVYVDLGSVNRSLESHLYAAESNSVGEATGFSPNGIAAEEGEGDGGWETLRLSSDGVEDAPIGAAGCFGPGRIEDGVADVPGSGRFARGAPSRLGPQVGGSRTLPPQLQGGTRNMLLEDENRPVFPPQQRAHRVNGYLTNGASGGFTPATTATTTGATYGATSSLSAASGSQASFYDDSTARRMIANPPPTLPFSLVPLSHASNVQMANRFLGTEDQTFLSNYSLDEILPATTAPVSFINCPPRSHRRLASISEDEGIDGYGRPSHSAMRRNPSLSELIGEPGPSTTPWRSALLRPVRAVSDTVQSTRARVRRSRTHHHQSFGMSRLDSEPQLFSGSNNSIERIRNRARRHRATPPAGILFGDMNSPDNIAFVD
ncbi:hypothetical protein B0T14DRAFT_20567 [Immersiella caudata]|uniref:Uncharacterized protein n=1 Tax=Immersiella caudata TaxID=314043 RepID=A0AA40CC41_9PEZI|nr:hypothetical protein B0T14DRAFT_20567 [Immersiella caudata]